MTEEEVRKLKEFLKDFNSSKSKVDISEFPDGFAEYTKDIDEVLEELSKDEQSKFYSANILWELNEPEKSPNKTTELENLSVFKLADELSDEVWELVSGWKWFAKKTIGDQWVRSTDSVGANIAEGYGRYYFGEYLIFLYYARGSLKESIYWASKAKKRELITEEEYGHLNKKYGKLPLELNKVIKIVKNTKKKWKGKPKC